MRKALATSVAVLALLLASVGAAAAHSLPPCNDADGDGSSSGAEYAAHHIVALASVGELGSAHVPGAHQGFSLCLGVHE